MKAGFIFVVLAIVGALAYFGFFYDTGAQWYDACWRKMAATKDEREPIAPDSSTASIWQRCDVTNDRSIYAIGFIFTVDPKDATDTQATVFTQACPRQWDIAFRGMTAETLKLIGEQGGVTIFDRFLPADLMIERVWRTRWPNCDAERRRQGYPRIVEVRPGQWGWETPCLPCVKRGEPAN